jgi:hypothetical protein
MGRYDLYESKTPYALISVVLIIVIALLGMVYFLAQDSEEQPFQQQLPLSIPSSEPLPKNPEANQLSNEQPQPESGQAEPSIPLESLPEQESAPLPPLSESDSVFKLAVLEVSSALEPWVIADELIKKYLIIVNDFAQGLHPHKHFNFLSPGKPFRVNKDVNGIYIAKQSYQRYDQLAAAVDAIDINKAVGMFKLFRPLLQQVFVEFGYAEDYQLEDIFKKAAANIIQAPVIVENVRLIRPAVYYKYADQKLEALNPVQKQMLRMGPENTRIIQAKLRLLLEAFIAD